MNRLRTNLCGDMMENQICLLIYHSFLLCVGFIAVCHNCQQSKSKPYQSCSGQLKNAMSVVLFSIVAASDNHSRMKCVTLSVLDFIKVALTSHHGVAIALLWQLFLVQMRHNVSSDFRNSSCYDNSFCVDASHCRI